MAGRVMAGRVSIVGWAVLVVCAVVGLVSCSGGRAPVDASGCEIDWTERDVGRLHVPQEIAVGPKWETYLLDRAGMLWEIDLEQRVLRSAFGCRGEVIGQFGQPTNLGVAPDGAVWVTYPGEGLVVEFLGDGEVGRTVCASPSAGECRGQPGGVAFSSAGDEMWVADSAASQVLRFSVSADLIRQEDVFEFDYPTSVAVADGGLVLVVDLGSDLLVEIRAGNFGRSVELDNPVGVQRTPDGRVLLSGGLASRDGLTGHIWEWVDGQVTELAVPGDVSGEYPERGDGVCLVGAPRGIGATADGGLVWVELGDNGVYYAEPDCAAIYSIGNGGRR